MIDTYIKYFNTYFGQYILDILRVKNFNCPSRLARCHKITTRGKFPLAAMGVLAPGSAHARPSAQPPIDTSGNFSSHVFAE